MKKTTMILAAALVLTGLSSFIPSVKSPADAAEWKLDNTHSSVSFTVAHLGTPLMGGFKKYDVALRFDPANPDGSSLNVTIDAASIDTRSEGRDEHLKGADFFDVTKFPNATFKSEKVTKKSDKEFLFSGTLTVKGVAKKAEVTFLVNVNKEHPYAKDKMLLGVTATTKMKRTEFGVGGADTNSLGDDVDITFYGEFSKAK